MHDGCELLDKERSGSHHSRCCLGVVLPLVRQTLGTFIVAGQSVNPRLHQNQSVLGRFVLTAFLHMSADVDCLLNHAVDILRDLGRTPCLNQQLPFFLSSLTIF